MQRALKGYFIDAKVAHTHLKADFKGFLKADLGVRSIKPASVEID